jgi:alpha-N-arabinofuranosidase
MIAEGGTDFHHSVTIARSRDITVPYVGCPSNPILTHRHLGRNYPIVNAGHGDLVETQNGEWWMVLLASRPYGGYYRNLGRETFLVPVIWEDGWPVASPGTGKVEFSYPYPDLPRWEIEPPAAVDHFDKSSLDPCWMFLRTPREEFCSLTERPGYLRLKVRPKRLTELANPSLVCRRQQHMSFTARTVLEFVPDPGEAAGMVLLQSDRYHYRMEYALEDDQTMVRLVRCMDGIETIINAVSWRSDRFEMMIMSRDQDYSFYFGDGEEKIPLAQNVDGRILSTDVAGGFVGTTIGLYASGNGRESLNTADFDLFEYRVVL